MPWVEHAAWAVFALVALVGLAFAKSLDDRDERLEPRSKRSWARESAVASHVDFEKTDRIPLRRVKADAAAARAPTSSDRPSQTSDRPSGPGGALDRVSQPGASDRPSHPSDRPASAATRSESTRRAFDRGSLPPE